MGKKRRVGSERVGLAAFVLLLAGLAIYASTPSVISQLPNEELISGSSYGDDVSSDTDPLRAAEPDELPSTSATVIVTDAKTGRRHVYPPYRCSFGYRKVSRIQGGCGIRSVQIRPGDTVGRIAERLGRYSKWGELCYFAPYGVRYPGEFDYQRLRSGPGYRVGGCP